VLPPAFEHPSPAIPGVAPGVPGLECRCVCEPLLAMVATVSTTSLTAIAAIAAIGAEPTG
jgi:hypothetical protein